MKPYKRFFALMLAGALLLACAACGGEPNNDEQATGATAVQLQPSLGEPGVAEETAAIITPDTSKTALKSQTQTRRATGNSVAPTSSSASAKTSTKATTSTKITQASTTTTKASTATTKTSAAPTETTVSTKGSTSIVVPEYTAVITGPSSVKSGGHSIQLRVTVTDANGNALPEPEGGDWSWRTYNTYGYTYGYAMQNPVAPVNGYAIGRDGLLVTGEHAFYDTLTITYANSAYKLHATHTVHVVE